MNEFINGLFLGLIQKDDLANIQTCMKGVDVTTLTQELQTSLVDFKEMNVGTIVAGAKVVGKIIQKIQTDLGECEAMAADVAKIKAWANIFNDQEKLNELLMKNTEHYMDLLSHYIPYTEVAYESKDYKDVGVGIA